MRPSSRTLLPLVVMLLAQGVGAQTASPILPAQHPVEIELRQDLSSERLRDGQAVELRLVRPLEVDGVELLRAGVPVEAKIISLKTARRAHRNGAFDVAFEPLRLSDGTLVHLDFHRPHRVNDKAEKVGGQVAGGLVLAYYYPLLPVYLIGLAQKGKPFTIRAGERYVVYVTGTEPPPQTSAPPSPQ